MCADYKKFNKLSKLGTFSIPHIDDCIHKIRNAKCVAKFDLLKGFWQIPLTDQAKKSLHLSHLQNRSRPKSCYRPYGMKNSPLRLINEVITNIHGCKAYIDDVILVSST